MMASLSSLMVETSHETLGVYPSAQLPIRRPPLASGPKPFPSSHFKFFHLRTLQTKLFRHFEGTRRRGSSEVKYVLTTADVVIPFPVSLLTLTLRRTGNVVHPQTPDFSQSLSPFNQPRNIFPPWSKTSQFAQPWFHH
jgi:hypothetical protein